MEGYLTTHVLDTARGRPAAGLRIRVYGVVGEARTLLAEMTTNADGRTDAPILGREDFATGVYELVFHAGAYLDAHEAPNRDCSRQIRACVLGNSKMSFELKRGSEAHAAGSQSP